MQLGILGLVSIDTLVFRDGKSYVGGGGLATAWISSLWNNDTSFYSINSNVICNKIIDSNLSINKFYIKHRAIGTTGKTTHFSITYDELQKEYKYKITYLNSAVDELAFFLAEHEKEAYIKLPASNFYQLKKCRGNFSVNPQGKFKLREFCNKIMTTGFIFLNNKELLDCSEMAFLPTLKYIEQLECSFVITLGEHGSICYFNKEKRWWYCPSIFAKSYITTLGCGDAFAGGFLAAYCQHLPIYQCLAKGTFSAYCATQAPSNMVTRWFDEKSLTRITAMYEYICSFNSAEELCAFLERNMCIPIKIELSFNEKIQFSWVCN